MASALKSSRPGVGMKGTHEKDKGKVTLAVKALMPREG